MATLAMAAREAFYTPEKAAQIAALYSAGDEDWTYTVNDYGNGWARVEIHDEDGEFVGYADE